MTDHETKKLIETRGGNVRVSSLHARGAGSQRKTSAPAGVAAPDPFDDEELDAVLRRAIDGTAEPRLLLVDKLLTGTRVRREV